MQSIIEAIAWLGRRLGAALVPERPRPVPVPVVARVRPVVRRR
jgi:hypothetical protein